MARNYLGRERAEHTLQPTALVNEAWLRLRDQRRVDWQGRTHVLAVGAQAMRRVLIDHGRGRRRQKRGGGEAHVTLHTWLNAVNDQPVEVEDALALDAAKSDAGPYGGQSLTALAEYLPSGSAVLFMARA